MKKLHIINAIAIFLFLAYAPSLAQSKSAKEIKPKACLDIAGFKKQVMPSMPGAILTSLDEGQVNLVLRNYNSIPPVSTLKANEIFVVSPAISINKIVLIMNKGCLVKLLFPPPAYFEKLFGEAA